MKVQEKLVPANEMARRSPVRFPNESADYRAARTALLAEEIELRRQIERVARQRRALPPGGPVTGDYRLVGEEGPLVFGHLFGAKDTLVAYSFMYGPERRRPCPMCTALMSAWDGEALDIGQRVSFVMIARSPIDRLVAFKRERGWRHLRIYSDPDGAYTRDYVHPEDADVPAYTVFTRRDGTIRHFWSGEMVEGDPGEDPRGAPDLMPLWTVLDTTPEGRGNDWYPRLDYPG
jgi:predicted dithiol-disulfide oxidoreductase (DUF899 family)